MDFTILAIVLGTVALALGICIYLMIRKIFETEKPQLFIYALLALIISDLMIVFLTVLCVFKATGIA